MAKFRTMAWTFCPQVTVSHTTPCLSILCLCGLPACFPPVTRASDRNCNEERAIILQLLTHGTDGLASGWSGREGTMFIPQLSLPLSWCFVYWTSAEIYWIHSIKWTHLGQKSVTCVCVTRYPCVLQVWAHVYHMRAGIHTCVCTSADMCTHVCEVGRTHVCEVGLTQ